MMNSERSGSRGRSESPAWSGLVALGVVTGGGIVLGDLVGGLLFRSSSGGLPDHPHDT